MGEVWTVFRCDACGFVGYSGPMRCPMHNNGGPLMQGVDVVSRAALEASEARVGELTDALEQIEACNRSRKCAACRDVARAALSSPSGVGGQE